VSVCACRGSAEFLPVLAGEIDQPAPRRATAASLSHLTFPAPPSSMHRPILSSWFSLARSNRTFTSSSAARWATPRPALAGLPFDIHPEVAAAQAEGRAVVALESTLITHGKPLPSRSASVTRPAPS